MNGYKVVLLGAHNVGKTTLVNSILGVEESHPRPTVVTMFSSFSEDGRDYYIWDTAGMEQYSALNGIYLRGAHVVIYCESFLPGEHGSAFLAQYKEYLEGVEIIYVLTKDDLLEDPMYEKQRAEFERFERLSGRRYNYVVDARWNVSTKCIRREIVRRCEKFRLEESNLLNKEVEDTCC